MYHEIFARNLPSGEIAITAKAHESPLALQKGSVLVEVERAVLDASHLVQDLSSESSEQVSLPLEWCSLNGRVLQAGQDVNKFQAGDRVSAIGPVANRVLLPAQECLELQTDVNPDHSACWALLVALIRFTRKLYLEIGESVLVLGGGLTGHIMAQLSLMSGATLVVGFSPKQRICCNFISTNGTSLSPTWVNDRKALRELLHDDRVDILIDVSGDVAEINDALPLIRDGGRTALLSVNRLAPSNFDFYPDIHRRSLKLTTGTLRTTLRQSSPDENRPAKETAFIKHLLKTDQLNPANWGLAHTYLPLKTGQLLSLSEKLFMIVDWDNHDESD